MTDYAQIENGRIIIDPKMWSTYNPRQRIDLEPLDNPPSMMRSDEDEYSPFFANESDVDENHPYASGLRAIQAMGRDVLYRYMNRKRRPRDVQAKCTSASRLDLSRN